MASSMNDFTLPSEFQFNFTVPNQSPNFWQQLAAQLDRLTLSVSCKQRLTTSTTNSSVNPVSSVIKARKQGRHRKLRTRTIDQCKCFSSIILSFNLQLQCSKLSASQNPSNAAIESSPATNFFDFLKLPAELRNQIYSYLLISPAVIRPQIYPHVRALYPPGNRIYPEISRVSKQLRLETLGYLYWNNTFRFHGLIAPQASPWNLARFMLVETVLQGPTHLTSTWNDTIEKSCSILQLQHLQTLCLEIRVGAIQVQDIDELMSYMLEALTQQLHNHNLLHNCSNYQLLEIDSVSFISGRHGKSYWNYSSNLRHGTVVVGILRHGAKRPDYFMPVTTLSKDRECKWKTQEKQFKCTWDNMYKNQTIKLAWAYSEYSSNAPK